MNDSLALVSANALKLVRLCLSLIAFHNLQRIVRIHIAVGILTDQHHRSQTASAQASDGFKAESAILGCFPYLKTDFSRHDLKNFFRSFNIASGPEAKADGMSAPRRDRKE